MGEATKVRVFVLPVWLSESDLLGKNFGIWGTRMRVASNSYSAFPVNTIVFSFG